MTKKECPTCGSNMGIGASTAENVKVIYECWCGEVVTELYSEEELPKIVIEATQPTAAPITV